MTRTLTLSIFEVKMRAKTTMMYSEGARLNNREGDMISRRKRVFSRSFAHIVGISRCFVRIA